ncbi:MAG: radical SAM protein [Candidatus Latescibacterota bacterium]
MQDSYGRTIRYLRISVTDRCNLRCHYCLPDGNEELLRREDLLSFEEISHVSRAALELGFKKIRLTGGEPLVRAGIVDLVGMVASLQGLEDFSMTTNGVLLESYADALVRAGLQRVNISLDTVDPVKFREITRGGDFSKVLAGIEAAKRAGFAKIKLNCVVERSSTETDAQQVAKFAAERDIEVRFIRHMNLAEGTFWVVEGGSGGQCDQCDRLRVSSDGIVRPCLFSNVGFSVRELGAREAIERAVRDKPKSGEQCHNTTFRRIGG